MGNEPATATPPLPLPHTSEDGKASKLAPVSPLQSDGNSKTNTILSEPNRPKDIRPRSKKRSGEKTFLYAVITTTVVFLLVATAWFSLRATASYSDAAQAATEAYAQGNLGAQDALMYRFVFARAEDAALIKGGTLLLSFLVVVLGALMVLEGTQAFYKLSLEGEAKKSALETSSPGLVMISLGLALAYGVISYKTEIDLTAVRRASPQDTQRSETADTEDNNNSQALDPHEEKLPTK
ncbi:hypothetical protein NR798_10140 [Archangium gephyra]|uniref:hypothetical protein n=1 Tax=Archangium gephyra TaxID=48 RepID=UPI0035D52454